MPWGLPLAPPQSAQLEPSRNPVLGSWQAIYEVGLQLWEAESLTLRQRLPAKVLPPIAKALRPGLRQQSQAKRERHRQAQMPQTRPRLDMPQMPRWMVNRL